MILASHAVIGAAVGRLMPSPFLAFLAGLLSHYMADAIPHWDYAPPSILAKKNSAAAARVRMADLLHVGADLAAGIALTFAIFPAEIGAAEIMFLVMGALGGLLPDPLQFIYFLSRKEPLGVHQKFHDWIHAPTTLRHKPALGIFFQAVLVAGCVLASHSLA